MQAHIRLATHADIAALLELDRVCALADQIGDQPLYLLAREGVIDWFLQHDGLIVAEEAGQLVGFLLVHLVEQMHGCDALAWVEHITVHPDFRRRGIATAMLSFARNLFRGKASHLHGGIHPKNAASRALFASLGADTADRVQFYVPV